MARPSRIIDQWGNPIDTGALTRELAAPALGSVRSVWNESVVTALDPVAMAQILRQAGRGWPDRFFTLAEEMEERDLHYRSVLGTRKLAITGVEPIVVEAPGEGAKGKKIAEAVREMIAVPEFTDDYTTDLLDALAKSYSLVETVWDRSGKEWWPKAWKWRDQRFFQLDQVDGRTLRLKDPGTTDGLDLPPYQFSIHRPKLKSGLPIRAGLALPVAWAFMFKHYSIKDWMAFLEVYGMPLRVGRYGPNSGPEERRVLLQAVRDISTDAAAIIPKGMDIEFIEAKGSGGSNGLFSAMAEYLDKQVSKGVLGQTMSTDDGASLSQAKVHEEVRHDIARADARQTSVTANRDLIRAFVDLNFGPQDRYPTMVIPIVESEDVKALAEVVERLVNLGMEIGADAARERIGFEKPEPGAVLLRPSRSIPAPSAEEETPPPGKETARLAKACPHCGGHHALAAEEVGEQDELDLLVEEALSHWQADIDPLLEPLRRLVETARDYDELRAGLERLTFGEAGAQLVARLATLGMKARGLGDTGRGR
ncbi:MAG: DUF935 domain-containing protein [Aquamicrobium sp.]|nr:DUF935 domain-containing protein [Aquamicrobium sp.]